MEKFIHLHVHSHYSLLSGLAKIKDIVKAAKKRGFSSVALTDYGGMYGAIEFYKACKKEEIKPIIGFEAFVAPRKHTDKDPELDKGDHRLILLAENYNGYRNLMKLCSIGHVDGLFNGIPRIDKDLLREYGSNIIALSGPIASEIPQLLKENKIEEAANVAKEYEEIFGKDNFYLELEDHPAISGQIDVNTKMIELSKKTGVPLVVTRDVHYLNSDDNEAQDILRCIREGWRVDDTNRSDYRHVDRSFNTAADIMSRFRHVPEALENTVKIANRINIEIELDNWHFAPVELPPGKTADEHLRDEAYKYVGDYYPELTDELKERIEYELDIIKTKGYSPYFICIADVVRYAKSQGIVESTRGSAAGSLVSYVLGITTVDPIRFKLPFERFLNPFRPSPPDIDTDFADDRRDEMIKYVTDKYGKDKVAQIITFGTMAARASVRDVGRALGYSYSFCDQVAKLIPVGAQGFPMTIERALNEEPDLKKLYNTNAEVKRLLDLGQKVEGCARHTSIHAAGVVISPTPLTDFTPVQLETGGERLTTQYDMHAVEAAGVLKNDFLGIRNLSILGKAVEIVKATTGEEVDIYNLPLDDKKTFEMISRGETLGVFQFGSSGMQRWIKELKPTNIDDIMAMVALYRPGPMDFIPEYIARAHDPEKIDYPHPDLEEILEKSLGLLIYQDDVMLTAIKLAGYDWLEADKFRKAMGKKIPELMKEQEKKFKDGCVKNNIAKKTAEDLWERIKPFATYAFNKAHAASYGIVAYQTAYMKANYPVQYMTAVLQAEAHDSDKVAAIFHECRRMGIKVLPPDINESFRNFAIPLTALRSAQDKGEPVPPIIRFGLTAIKNVGDHICEVIYKERKENGQYKDLEDLLTRVADKDLNKKSISSLAQAGALDAFGIDRGVLLANIEQILFFSKSHKEKAASQQGSLFAGTDIAFDSKVILKDAAPATMDQKLVWEKNLLGIYVSSHPFAKYQDVLEGTIVPLSQVEDLPRDEWVVIGGIVATAKKKITKKGSIMMFVTLQDMSGYMELLVFPKTYEKTQDLWQDGALLCVVGKTPRDEGDNKVLVEKGFVITDDNIEAIRQQLSMGGNVERQTTNDEQINKFENSDDERPSINKTIELRLTSEEVKEHAESLRKLFENYSGEYQIFVAVGTKTIKAGVSVAWGQDLALAIEEIIGEGRVRVQE